MSRSLVRPTRATPWQPWIAALRILLDGEGGWGGVLA